MRDIELMKVRRQVLDWRDEWLSQIPTLLAKDLPQLLRILNVRIDQLSFSETFKTGNFVKANLQPAFQQWINSKSLEIVKLAEKDLEPIQQEIIDYNHTVEERIDTDTSRKNVTELGLATGSTGAALLGVPAVATLSVHSAGWGLGLLGVTVISWPVALGGAAVLGTMAVLGGSKLAKYKDKAVHQLKESVEATIRSAVLGSRSDQSSVQITLQNHIRSSASTYLETLQRV